MSLLFDQHSSSSAHFAVDDHRDNGDVLVGPHLWAKLAEQSSLTRLCLSLRPTQEGILPKLPSLVCWATRDEQVGSSRIAIPFTWPKRYPGLFPQSSLLKLSVLEPLVLSEVVLVAFSLEAFEVANDQESFFDPWLDEGSIIRQGDILEIPVSNSEAKHRFTVETTDPVLQGIVKKGSTRIVVLLSEDEDNSPDDGQDQQSEDSADLIEIDANFLASSALSKPFRTHTPSKTEGSPHYTHDRDSEASFTCAPLSRHISRLEDDSTLYLRTSDLGRLGLLNSDWAVVVNSATQYRLVRVVVDNAAVENSGQVKTSPTLYFNIARQESTDFTPNRSIAIQLLPSPFGSHRPFIPTAKSITVARVASPFSVNRQYQDLFLGGLKSYFDDAKHLVKQGDLIAVPIDGNAPRWLQDPKEDGAEQATPLLLGSSSQKHENVYFMITNIEYEVLDDSSSAQYNDLYLGCRVGELGCWVDVAVTRIVQAGLEHSRVPDPGSYHDPERRSSAGKLEILEERKSALLSPTNLFGRLLSMTSASMTKWALDCHLDLTFLLKGQRGTGKFTTISWVAQRLGIHLIELDCYDLIGENDTKTEGTLRYRFSQAVECSPCIIVLRKLEAFAQSTQPTQGKESALTTVLQECTASIQKSWKETGFPVILVGTVSEPGQVPPSILSQFKYELNSEVPDEPSRFEILNCLLDSAVLSSDVSVSNLATQTAALVAADLVDLVSRAKTLSLERTLKDRNLTKSYVRLSGVGITAADFEAAVGKVRDAYSESIGAPKIPTVTWDDVGGLAHVKADILDTIQLPLERPELFADGLKKRSGILLYGPPGTGKTLIAKAVATSCSLNFFSVKGPELLNMYIGESEANVRRVFQKARDAKPCVIFFDELDSVAPKRGNHGDSGGVMDRIVSQLLAELDGMAAGGSGADVFVIGATNRPDLLDPALLRPGRFDRMLYLGVSDTHEAQFNILEALTRKFRLDPDLDLRAVAERCPFNYTGADLYALCSDAMLNAMSRKAMMIDAKIAVIDEPIRSSTGVTHPFPITPQYYLSEIATPEEIRVTVTGEDFDTALRNLVPSVSEAEMEHYAIVQKRFTQDESK